VLPFLMSYTCRPTYKKEFLVARAVFTRIIPRSRRACYKLCECQVAEATKVTFGCVNPAISSGQTIYNRPEGRPDCGVLWHVVVDRSRTDGACHELGRLRVSTKLRGSWDAQCQVTALATSVYPKRLSTLTYRSVGL
jgi:hypothetical protein